MAVAFTAAQWWEAHSGGAVAQSQADAAVSLSKTAMIQTRVAENQVRITGESVRLAGKTADASAQQAMYSGKLANASLLQIDAMRLLAEYSKKQPFVQAQITRMEAIEDYYVQKAQLISRAKHAALLGLYAQKIAGEDEFPDNDTREDVLSRLLIARSAAQSAIELEERALVSLPREATILDASVRLKGIYTSILGELDRTIGFARSVKVPFTGPAEGYAVQFETLALNANLLYFLNVDPKTHAARRGQVVVGTCARDSTYLQTCRFMERLQTPEELP